MVFYCVDEKEGGFILGSLLGTPKDTEGYSKRSSPVTSRFL